MRDRRPEIYSDTGDRQAYVLDRPTLEYHLQSLTSRNETHEFEIFCRKLCERVLCPRLRPHSGPDGGGDGKTDSESIQVAEEIADLTFIGVADGGKSKLAFAFSAKEKWTDKVRSDVKNIVGTGRDIDRIYFVTNQFARAQTVGDLEKSLQAEYGIPVTILDRSWIVEQILDHDRLDLAYNYLGVGTLSNDPLRLGPTDYSRTRELAEIERQIEDPATFEGMESQLVSEALVAAKLSRNLERPKVETDGRLARAVRLAKKYGSYRQKLQAEYEVLWTAVWWFDDLELLNDSYDEFAEKALGASHIRDLEFLTNLLQLLFNAVIHDGLSREEARLDERAAVVRLALQAMAEEVDRPNNSLGAQTSLLLMRLNFTIVDHDRSDLPAIWAGFCDILDKADGLGEFSVESLAQILDAAGQAVGNDPHYNNLIEKLADFIAKRESEVSGARVLLKRAEKLSSDDHFDIIRFAGRAATRLAKRETTSELVKALQLLTIAYRHAGLLWVARASCAFVACAIVIEGEEDGRLSRNFIPTMKIWAWLSLELGHLPDTLLMIQMWRGAAASLGLEDHLKAKVEEDLREIDSALAALLLNADHDQLERLTDLPDLLEALDLTTARLGLLYVMGHEQFLREEGSIPAEENSDGAREVMSKIASQPVVAQSAKRFLLNDGLERLSTTLLGLRVRVDTDANECSLLAAEIVLATLEAFFATSPQERIAPFVECLDIEIRSTEEAEAPFFSINAAGTRGQLVWPAAIAPHAFSSQSLMHTLLMDLSAAVLAHCFMTQDVKGYARRLFSEDAVQGRMSLAAVASNSYHRIWHRFLTMLDDFECGPRTVYPLGDRPRLDIEEVADGEGAGAGSRTVLPAGRGGFEVTDHRTIQVFSVLDVAAWDQAEWCGAGYIELSPEHPPAIALVFRDEVAARAIFEGWLERFGQVDENDEIYLALIREHDADNPAHYILQVAGNPGNKDALGQGALVTTSRSIEGTPATSENVDFFLRNYEKYGCFWIMPAVLGTGTEPELLTNLAILKERLRVRNARDIDDSEIESVALRGAGHDQDEGCDESTKA